MAYQDSLFQLGMDLTRSSTAQKEDIANVARVAHNVGTVSGRHADRSKNSNQNCTEYADVGSDAVPTAGNHFIVDLYSASKLDDVKYIEQTIRRCVQVAGATLLHIHLQRYTPEGGVSGVAVMAGGHISFYSLPETGFAALDLMMHTDHKASLCIDVLTEAFKAGKVTVKASLRGEDIEPTSLRAAVAPSKVQRTNHASVETSAPARSRVRKAA